MKRHLLAHERKRFSRAVARKILIYALGRSAELADDEVVDRLAKQFAKNGYRLSDLIVAIVQSEEFRTK